MLARTPWTPVVEKKAEKRLGEQRKRALRDHVIEIMRHGEPTHFAFEGACRHGLRAALVLNGWRWPLADHEAAAIVAAALSALGAKRPTWEQGQPEYVQWGAMALLRSTCINCGRPLPASLGDKPRIFCSDLCQNAHHMRMWARDHVEEARARFAAFQLAWTARQPERRCAGCGELFRPRAINGRGKYCSNPCYQRSRRLVKPLASVKSLG